MNENKEKLFLSPSIHSNFEFFATCNYKQRNFPTFLHKKQTKSNEKRNCEPKTPTLRLISLVYSKKLLNRRGKWHVLKMNKN